MLLAWPNGDDLAGGVIKLAVDEPESLRSLARYVELHPGQASQVAADAPRPKCLADNPTMREVVGDGRRGRDDVGPVVGQGDTSAVASGRGINV
jgi:hypothetical protein